MNQEATIVVMSCDAYSDLWHGFFSLKEANWPDCQYDTYLVTNNKKCTEPHVKTVLCGDETNWTGRLKKCILALEQQYVILLLEDYYISATVSNETVRDVIDFISSNNVGYYKLETRGTVFPKVYQNTDYRREITPDIRYGISLVTSIWDRDFLLETLGDDDYPAWEFEIRRNQLNDITHNTDRLCLCDTRNILNIEHMVQRGKYIRSAIRNMDSRGIHIDTGKRGKLSALFDLYHKINTRIKRHKFLREKLLKAANILGIKSISQKYEEEMKSNRYH